MKAAYGFSIYGDSTDGWQIDIDQTFGYLRAAGIPGLASGEDIQSVHGDLITLEGTVLAYRGTRVEQEVEFKIFCRDNGVFVDWSKFVGGPQHMLVKIHPQRHV